MTNDRLWEIAAMEMDQLQEELGTVNEKIAATPFDAEGFPVQSPSLWDLLDEKSVIEDCIDITQSGVIMGVRKSTASPNAVVEGESIKLRERLLFQVIRQST